MKKWIKIMLAVWIFALSLTTCILAQLYFFSPTVHVRTVEGTVEVSVDQETWQTTELNVWVGEAWFARFVADSGATGEITLFWQLVEGVMENPVEDANVTTVFTLSGLGDAIYATSDGQSADNTNWGNYCIQSGDYKVVLQT